MTYMNIGDLLKHKKLILGVCGGIAAYKTVYLVRLLVKQYIDVHVVMTPNATKFITPLTFQAITNNHVWIEEWDSTASNSMAHINLTRNIDGIIICPATANTIAKFNYGIADNLLLSMLLAKPQGCPVWIAPAMNTNMLSNSTTINNIA